MVFYVDIYSVRYCDLRKIFIKKKKKQSSKGEKKLKNFHVLNTLELLCKTRPFSFSE